MGIVITVSLPLARMYGDHATGPSHATRESTTPPRLVLDGRQLRPSHAPGLRHAGGWVILVHEHRVAKPKGPVQGGPEQGIAGGAQDATFMASLSHRRDSDVRTDE
jgi:hypothetical protein